MSAAFLDAALDIGCAQLWHRKTRGGDFLELELISSVDEGSMTVLHYSAGRASPS